MKSRAPAGFLHLQLGQEIIYLMLAGALAASFVLASLVAGQRDLEDEIARLRAVETPPIITLAEADGYYFESGSAELSPAFRTRILDDVIPRVVDASETYGATVVEVVGHTDESPLRASSESNLDIQLLGYLDGQDGEPLRAADNAGLGMARAAAVARVLLTDARAHDLVVLPMSAGQAAEPGDALASPGGPLSEQYRRRIEIRLRRPVLH